MIWQEKIDSHYYDTGSVAESELKNRIF